MYTVKVYNMLEELVFLWKINADNKEEAYQKVREVYPIAETDSIVIEKDNQLRSS